MPDPFDAQVRTGGPQEVEVDLAAFLPEGTSVVPGAGGDGDPGMADGSAASVPRMDLTHLARIEAEIADVDAALDAIDAGEPDRSALLRLLLAQGPSPDRTDL